MSSRRSASNRGGNRLVLAQEVLQTFETARLHVKTLPSTSIEVGLLCGTSLSQYSILAAIKVPEPSPTEASDATTRRTRHSDASLNLLDDGVIRTFAYKVHRMLCGASQILGLYIIASSDLLSRHGASFETILKSLRLDRTTTATWSASFFLATIVTNTGVLSTSRYTFTEKTSSPTPETMQFGILAGQAKDLVRVETRWRLDLLVPVKRAIAGEHEQRFHKALIKVVTDEISKIENSIIAVDGSNEIVNSPSELDEELPTLKCTSTKLPEIISDLRKSSSSSTSGRAKSKRQEHKQHEKQDENDEIALPRKYVLLSRCMTANESTSFVSHQVASGALRLVGDVVGVAWIQPHKPGFQERAAFELRVDLIKTLQSRVGLLFDALSRSSIAEQHLNNEEMADKTSTGRANTFQVTLPSRVAQRTLSTQHVALCDYLSGDERLSSSLLRLQHVLQIPADSLDVQMLETSPTDSDGIKKHPFLEAIGDTQRSSSENSSSSASGNHKRSTSSGPPLIPLPWMLVLILSVLLALFLPVFLGLGSTPNKV